ncbi:hypothetical protein [Oceanibacterium hippocampi]|uniref:GspD-like N0 domain-containing protein n=1 Tax=Oceanibacterium hippocampi TaxID=745714 RepID=A0A1Y5TBQ0_9PROT|nr:hypothetical protein [Oceanibacterium hippocampi]SLN56790.1 hypothetical protein OCH7691_02477 [Oceanibacterium hippocampi]
MHNPAGRKYLATLFGVAFAMTGTLGGALAQQGQIRDPENGCATSNPFPNPNESITWNGACKDGLLEGPGTLTWFRDGAATEKDVGTFRRGELEGQAEISFADGSTIFGTYRAGQRHGEFIVFRPDGRYIRAIYEDGALVAERELTTREYRELRNRRTADAGSARREMQETVQEAAANPVAGAPTTLLPSAAATTAGAAATAATAYPSVPAYVPPAQPAYASVPVPVYSSAPTSSTAIAPPVYSPVAPPADPGGSGPVRAEDGRIRIPTIPMPIVPARLPGEPDLPSPYANLSGAATASLSPPVAYQAPVAAPVSYAQPAFNPPAYTAPAYEAPAAPLQPVTLRPPATMPAYQAPAAMPAYQPPVPTYQPPIPSYQPPAQMVRATPAPVPTPRPAAPIGQAAAGDPGELLALNFEDADLREVIRLVLGDVLGEPYSVDPAVSGRVSLPPGSLVRRDEMLPLLRRVMLLNGAELVRDQNGYRAVQVAGPNLAGGARIAVASDPESAFVAGYAKERVGDLAGAAADYDAIRRRFPGTQTAMLAEERLTTLQAAPAMAARAAPAQPVVASAQPAPAAGPGDQSLNGRTVCTQPDLYGDGSYWCGTVLEHGYGHYRVKVSELQADGLFSFGFSGDTCTGGGFLSLMSRGKEVRVPEACMTLVN